MSSPLRAGFFMTPDIETLRMRSLVPSSRRVLVLNSVFYFIIEIQTLLQPFFAGKRIPLPAARRYNLRK